MPDANAAPRKLVLIDGNSLLYRGFFAMRALTTSAGQPTNAVFSFTMMLLTLLEDQKPDVIVCAWDKQGSKTFRHEEFKEYKGTRQSTPPELVEQGPIAREMVQAFHIPSIEAEGFEADDIIGTLTRRGREEGYEVLVVSGDLDGLQLVKPGVRVMTTVKGVTDTVIYDEAAVENRYGLKPTQLTDYRALKGDTSDNIPGVPGVGEKTAATLLQKYGTVEELLEKLDEVTPAKVQVALTAARDQIAQSKRLATIVTDVPLEGVDLPVLDAAPHQPDWAKVRALFERLEFRTLLRRLPKVDGAEGAAPTPAAAPSVVKESSGADLDAEDYDPFAEDTETPAAASAPEPVALPPADHRDIDPADATAMRALTDAVRRAHRVGLRLHTSGEGLLDARLYGVALAVGDGTVFYVPVRTDPPAPAPAAPPADPNAIASLFDEPATAQEAIPAPSGEAAGGVTIPEELVALLEDPKVPKAAHDSKSDIAVLYRAGVTLRGVVFDTELAAYLLNAGRRASFPLHEVASDYAGRALHVLDKKERKAMDEDAIAAHEKAEAFKAAEAVLATAAVQEPRLAADGLDKVMAELDLPLSAIVAEMELTGLAVDVEALHRMARDLQSRIDALELDIFQMAGGEFTIGSTKQLQEVLFEKLKLPAGKRTKTGYSTDADTLEELAPDYPIVGKILQHRGLVKFKNTYAEAMPLLVRPDTGRIHTSLNQTVASTGRLSSSNPNLQNIPVRTEIGREIRRAFIAPDGNVLVSADYSQIELRIFAHVTNDPALVEAFESGEDIHKYTAGKMYNVPVSEVTSDMRRAAKTVNYAVIYGISEFALGRRLGISMTAAKELKTSYLDRFPGVREYIDKTVAFAREKGYAQTLFGRRRYFPDINSRVFQFRQAAERAAANMPIQGSSADIMKLAMQAVYAMLREEGFKSRMLLQVHDELLFESPPEEVQPLAARVREKMSGVYPLRVALEADVKTGKTWADVTPVADTASPLEGLEAG
jgi:DNA polymerase-1